jgi:hypothetical protein
MEFNREIDELTMKINFIPRGVPITNLKIIEEQELPAIDLPDFDDLHDLDEELKSLLVHKNVVDSIVYPEPDDEEILRLWSEGLLYQPLKLRGGGEGEGDELIQFGKDTKSMENLCNIIINNGYAIFDASKAILKILEEHNIITVDTTYNDVVANNKLVKTISSFLKMNLSIDKKLSKFGCGLISDFDLAVNLQSKHYYFSILYFILKILLILYYIF